MGLILAALPLSVATSPAAYADDCGMGGDCTGGEEGFSGEAVFTTKGKVFDPGGSGNGGSGPPGTWSVRQQCELGGAQTCHTGAMCDSDDDGSEDARLMDVRFMREGESDWRHVGAYCEGEEELVSLEDIGNQVEAKWQQYVPELKPTMEPPNGKALVGLRSVFDSGQKESFGPVTVPVYEFSIELSAKGKWFWKFSPESGEKEFSVPGSHYPDTRVGYTYEKAGKYEPTVRAEWSGSFTVKGHGPYTIPNPATQQPVSLPIEVVEKRSVLGN